MDQLEDKHLGLIEVEPYDMIDNLEDHDELLSSR